MARLGSVCKVNGVDAYETFGADLKSVEWLPGEVVANVARSLGRHSLRTISQSIGLCGMVLTFYVGIDDVEPGATDTMDEATADVYATALSSRLLEACRECVIVFGEADTVPSAVEYASVLSGYTARETGVPGYRELSMTFLCVRRLAIQSAVLTRTGTVDNQGAVECGVRLTVVATKAYSSLTVFGVTIKNLTANAPFVIDGIDGKVTQNGVNAFLQTDIIDFPRLQPGTNTIAITQPSGATPTGVTVTVEHYALFPL